ncbi:hypothetical protein AAEX63_03140 [Luteococcus sp. H138]
MALAPAATSWWQRNRVWLMLLVPLLAAAIASSSWAYVRLYRPQQFHNPQRSVDGTLHFVQHTRSVDLDYTIDVTMKLISFEPVNDTAWTVPAGQTLWRSTLQFEADPEAPLNGCGVSLRDQHGRRFVGNIGMKASRTMTQASAMQNDCVPLERGGPSVVMGTVMPAREGEERPRIWQSTWLWALPSDAVPTTLRVSWAPPDYAEFGIPVR